MKAATEPEAIAGRPWRLVRRLGLATGVLFFTAVAAGVVFGANEHGHGLTARLGVILAAILLMAIGCAWLLARDLKRPSGEEPLTRQERLNRNLLVASGALGGATAIIVIFAGGANVLSNDPLPPAVALTIVLLLGIIAPVIWYFWHKVVDEQEIDAYKTGTLYGFYVYGVGAPLWWFAARGGLLPPPDGVIIYYVTLAVVGIVWMKKKYG